MREFSPPSPLSPFDTTHAELNVDVLNLAASIAASLRGALHILHVWRVFGESMFTHFPYCRMNSIELEQYLDEAKQQHAKELHTLLDRCQADLPPGASTLEREAHGLSSRVLPGAEDESATDGHARQARRVTPDCR